MARRSRRNHSSAFIDNLALAAVRGDRTLAELVKQFDVHPNQIQDWKRQLLTKAEHVFVAGTADTATRDYVQQKRHAKIGQLPSEKDSLDSTLGPWPRSERKMMIKVKQELTVMIRQCGLLAVPRLSVYAQLTGCLGVRPRIDETARRALAPMAV